MVLVRILLVNFFFNVSCWNFVVLFVREFLDLLVICWLIWLMVFCSRIVCFCKLGSLGFVGDNCFILVICICVVINWFCNLLICCNGIEDWCFGLIILVVFWYFVSVSVVIWLFFLVMLIFCWVELIRLRWVCLFIWLMICLFKFSRCLFMFYVSFVLKVWVLSVMIEVVVLICMLIIFFV